MSLPTLPPPPPTLRWLTTDQSTRMDKVFPSKNLRFRCGTCEDTGVFRWYFPHDERDLTTATEYECVCNDQFRLRRRFTYSGIGLAWQKMGWADYTWGNDKVLAATGDYLDNLSGYVHAGMGLCLSGTGGTGKSMALMLIAKELVLEGYDVYAQTFHAMLEAFSAGWKDREDRKWYNERVRNAHVLVIDDVGKEHNKGVDSMGANALEEVLRHRVQNDLPTFMTTMKSAEARTAGYGGSTTDLMMEKMILVEVTGQSVREGKKRERDAAERAAGIRRPVLM